VASVAKFDTWQAADGTNVARFSGGELQVWNGSAWAAAGATSASGGTETTYNGYKYHAFTSNGTFTADNDVSVDYVIIAGGGGGGTGGGTGGGGGGGAGGVLVGSIALTSGSYPIVVGAGGSGTSDVSVKGSNGIDSTALGLTADGGGGGGSSSSATGADGASGGGGGASATSTNIPGGSPNNVITMLTGADNPIGAFVGEQGCSGGQGTQGNGGGGGGARTPGVDAKSGAWKTFDNDIWLNQNNGGFGIRLDDWGLATGEGDSYTYTGGTAVFFASGGNGGRQSDGNTPERVPGGGAKGGDASNLPGATIENTGGGGGGATDIDLSGSGASGIVIVRYAV